MKRTAPIRRTPLVRSKRRLRSQSNKTHARRIHEADILWSQLVLSLWKGRCAFCKTRHADGAHHLIFRRALLTRHALMNGIALCHECHGDAHEHGPEFMVWLAENYPEHFEWCGEMKAKAGGAPVHVDVEEVIEELRSALEQVAAL